MFVKDPCGIVCLIIIYSAIFYADYVVVRWIIMQSLYESLWGSFHVVLFNTVILFLAVAHLKAVLSDPGLVPLPKTKLDYTELDALEIGSTRPDWTMCNRCDAFRPPRAHHCHVCKRCIRRMDHHCPWINNCVGERNQKYFIQFLLYVGLLAAYSVALIVFTFVSECKACEQEITIKQARILHSVILLLESSLFGMFVSAILVDQMQGILTDEGGARGRRSRMALLGEVCGRGHPAMWLLPCATPRRLERRPITAHDI